MPKKTVHKKSWKAQQQHNKTFKRTKLAMAVLGFIILLLLVGKTISFMTNFQQPVSKDFLAVRGYSWDTTSNLNLVIKAKTISVLSFNPISKQVKVINLPDALYLTLPGGFGNWQLASVFDLGQAEKDKLGAKLLKTSLANFLGIPIDGLIEFTGTSGQKDAYQLVSILKDGIFAYIKLSPNIKTDLSSREILGFVWGLSKVRFDKINRLDLINTGVLDKSQLPDGTPIYTSDPDRIDSIAVKLAEDNIVSEKVPVAVLNATKTPGLAQKGARVIANLGGNVIISANASQTKGKSVIFVSSKLGQNSVTLKRLSEVFASDCPSNLKCAIIVCEMIKKYSPGDVCFTTDPQISDSRADINVVLGEDSNLRN